VKGECITLNAMLLEHLRDDLWHRALLENPLIVAELQVMQCWHQRQVITGQAFAGLTGQDVFDTSVNALTIAAKLQKCGLAEQPFQIEIRVLADQFNVNAVEGADRFGAVEDQHFEVMADSRNLQRKMRRVGRTEHTLILKQRGKKRGVQTLLGLCSRELASTLTRQKKIDVGRFVKAGRTLPLQLPVVQQA
jgi:hypothetical protein